MSDEKSHHLPFRNFESIVGPGDHHAQQRPDAQYDSLMLVVFDNAFIDPDYINHTPGQDDSQ